MYISFSNLYDCGIEIRKHSQLFKITMRFKALLLSASAIALTLTATSFAVNAQNGVGVTPTQKEMRHKEGKRDGKFEKLGLTESQRNQIAEIRKQGRSEIINNVLTQDQRTQLGNSTPDGKRGRGFRDLNLTEDQKNKIKLIMDSKKQQIDGILTTEQKQKLEEMKQSRRNNRRPSAPNS
jgi:periplasmic protein CpxP/Spy